MPPAPGPWHVLPRSCSVSASQALQIFFFEMFKALEEFLLSFLKKWFFKHVYVCEFPPVLAADTILPLSLNHLFRFPCENFA